jgi:hypothetical protein
MRGTRAVRLRVLGTLLLAIAGGALAATTAEAAEGPVNVSPPAISGIARDGQRLKVDKGAWGGPTPISYAYAWSRCDTAGSTCTSISSARSATYKPSHEDVGHTLRAIVAASNSGGNTSATTQPSEVVEPSPPAKRKRPVISGTPKDGQVLTVGNGTWRGTPAESFAYQWQACPKSGACADIPEATTASYRAATAQIGQKLRAVVTATNAVGHASASSMSSKPITAGPPVNTGGPAIGGSLQEGQTLSASDGQWAGTAPISFAYQWLRCSILGGSCHEITGATSSTYTAGVEDLASNLAVVVTASNAQGSASSTSPETQTILGILPTNTVLPSVSGLLADGGLLSIATGSWSGTQPISYAYQWQLCDALGAACENLAGATGSSLKLDPSEIGKTLQVVVTATNAAGSSATTTPLTGLIAGNLPTNTVLPAISGLLQDGGLLSIAAGSWSGSEPISYAYQWQLCNALGEACKDLAGVTGSSLKLDPSQIGKTLAVVVTATNAAGSTSVTSSITGLIAGILPKNTALPSITGTLQDGSLLSAATGSWSGSEPISYVYQWQLCNVLGESCKDLAGATGSSLKLDPSEIGRTLALVVTATNAAGSTSATSSVTSLIAGILPKNTALPSISGVLQDGQLLSLAKGSWSGSEPISYAYQWQLCNGLGKACEDLAGATGSSLKLDPSEIGRTLALVVTATNAAGSTSATSSVTSLIAGILPKNTALPSISGSLVDGQLLSVANGTWTGSEPISYSYQWQLCNASGASCSNISEAVGSTLKLSSLDVGKTLRLVVTAANSAGSTSATSAATSVIAALLPSNTTLPTVSGLLKNGQLLTASNGSWSGTTPMTFGYQWQLCNLLGSGCLDIAKATSSTFLLGLVDVGGTLRVIVTATNSGGSAPATSAVTGLIAGLGLSPTAGASGTTVSLSGKGVSAATKVRFGSAEASEVEVHSPGEITAEAPPGSGTVPVTVTTPEGSTQPNPADEFTYR